ncbi:MAG: NUDIX hydrolase [Frankiales bacterium]|nr:NUDIX hydrolase [Frankiales bacterium]
MDLADRPASYDVTDSTLAFASGRVVDVRTDHVRLPDGSTAVRDVVVHPGAVGVIALDEQDRVLLLQQYRHPVQRLLWEPPAGLLDEVGEDPLRAAQRELYEEAHYRADRWDVLIDVYTSPGMTDEAIRVYLAREVAPADGPQHERVAEERDMPVQWVPLAAAVDAVLSGRLHNPIGTMGILAAARARQSGFRDLRPADAPWPEMSAWPGSAAAHA